MTVTRTEIVVDASALVLALIGGDAGRAVRDRLDPSSTHAPHLLDAEVGSVLRRRELAGQLNPERAVTALGAARQLVGNRYMHTGPVGDAAWALRHNLSFYDALYVALATRLGIPLLTADARLTNAPGITCAVDLV
ncbi:type II toxin-antitoxin system VapC family toxin [Pseudonocardia nematodicida]|uniref:Ribonuclease VapC n=1 Tax=Pseudonocardia nematodicida TaxID=1206997 RepID=A0ABV1K879_9PSEU